MVKFKILLLSILNFIQIIPVIVLLYNRNALKSRRYYNSQFREIKIPMSLITYTNATEKDLDAAAKLLSVSFLSDSIYDRIPVFSTFRRIQSWYFCLEQKQLLQQRILKTSSNEAYQHHSMLVARQNETVVGFLEFAMKSTSDDIKKNILVDYSIEMTDVSKIPCIGNVAVDKMHRSRGIASSLMKIAIERLEFLGYPFVMCAVDFRNGCAIHIYVDKFDFKVVGHEKENIILLRQLNI